MAGTEVCALLNGRSAETTGRYEVRLGERKAGAFYVERPLAGTSRRRGVFGEPEETHPDSSQYIMGPAKDLDRSGVRKNPVLRVMGK